MSGGSSAFHAVETRLQQDLNNDGTIGTSRFDIAVTYTGDPAYQSYFAAAARRWEQVITADLPNVFHPIYGSIDDLRIDASVTFIDGR